MQKLIVVCVLLCGTVSSNAFADRNHFPNLQFRDPQKIKELENQVHCFELQLNFLNDLQRMEGALIRFYENRAPRNATYNDEVIIDQSRSRILRIEKESRIVSDQLDKTREQLRTLRGR